MGVCAIQNAKHNIDQYEGHKVPDGDASNPTWSSEATEHAWRSGEPEIFKPWHSDVKKFLNLALEKYLQHVIGLYDPIVTVEQ